MAGLDVQRNPMQFGDFLRDLSIELKSKDLEEMRLLLLAFDRVDEVLVSLRACLKIPTGWRPGDAPGV